MFTRAVSKPKALYIRVHNMLFFFWRGRRGWSWLWCGVAVTVLIPKVGKTITFWLSDAVHFIYFQVPSISGGWGTMHNLPEDEQYLCERGLYITCFCSTLHVIQCFAWTYEKLNTSWSQNLFQYLMYYFYVKTLKHFCHCPFLYIVSQQVDDLLCVGPQFLVPIVYTVLVNGLYGVNLLLLRAHLRWSECLQIIWKTHSDHVTQNLRMFSSAPQETWTGANWDSLFFHTLWWMLWLCDM